MFTAVDAGGTSTRAVVVDATGRVLGYGRSSGGNPTSAGIPAAVAAIGAAVQEALAGLPADQIESVLIAMAGEQTPAFSTQVTECLGQLGVGPVELGHDLLAMFCSGTARLEGYAVVAGTGSVAARVRDGRLDRVVGGRGWLLGDAGSGYWIGHRVARAVIEDLDRQGRPTALTGGVLAALGLGDQPVGTVLPQVVSALYARRPVQLSEFAPLAFRTAAEDAVAGEIVADAADALADLLAAVREPGLDGPVVLGGSVLVRGFLAGPAAWRDRLGLPSDEVVLASDGVVGAAVLALRGAGVTVDEPLFERIRDQVDHHR